MGSFDKPRGRGHKAPRRKEDVSAKPVSVLADDDENGDGFDLGLKREKGEGIGKADCASTWGFRKATSPANGPQPASSRIVFV